MKCQELYDHIPWKYKPFTHTFYDKKPENALLYIKPEYPTKKEYIADNKHVIQKYVSKRSEGMRD